MPGLAGGLAHGAVHAGGGGTGRSGPARHRLGVQLARAVGGPDQRPGHHAREAEAERFLAEPVELRNQTIRVVSLEDGVLLTAYHAARQNLNIGTACRDLIDLKIALTQGKGSISASVRKDVFGSGELTVERYETDQSYLSETLTQLDDVVRAFPVRGDVYG